VTGPEPPAPSAQRPAPEAGLPAPSAQRPTPDLRRILIVRLGSLGDIVHALPAVAALREAHPAAMIDWLVDRRNLEILRLTAVVDRAIVLERPTLFGWLDVIRLMRRTPYDVAIDLQGLMKSAVLARASGARRVLGFSRRHLREWTARPFYSETAEPAAGHVIEKNFALVVPLGACAGTWRFPLATTPSPALDAVRASLARDAEPSAGGTGLQPCDAEGTGGTGLQPCDARFALINPGAAWANKRWPADRFAAVARFLRERYGWRTVALWGPGEEPLARQVADASSGAAIVAPPTTIADLVELSKAAALMVSGDTGPLHIAGAAGTPLVGLFGPTDPGRNGPWAAKDRSISRYGRCGCPYRRRCRQSQWCLADITVDEVTRTIEERLSSSSPASAGLVVPT